MDKAKVFIAGTAYRDMTKEVFLGSGLYEISSSLTQSDIVVWTGGADIYPSLYGEKPIPGCYYNPDRDKIELDILDQVLPLNKFLVGICRGAQLLNCKPNGGTLWQDVNGHGSTIHLSVDIPSGKNVKLNSVHHQMMRPSKDGEIVAFTKRSTKKEAQNELWKGDPEIDPEVIWFPKTKSLCFQGHPEFGHPETTKYFHTLLDRYFWRDKKVVAA